MESRGDAMNARSTRLPAIPRRSCDQCRARKIGCDRGSPCSSCGSAKISCTFSAVVSKTATTKQRVLISAQYEQKIDEIVDGIETIKVLLQKPPLPADQGWSADDSSLHIPHSSTTKSQLLGEDNNTTLNESVQWNHSAQVNEFIRTVAEDRASREDPRTEESDVLASLRRLAWALEEPNVVRDLSFPETRGANPRDGLPLPPVETAVLALRWAKEHKVFFRIESVSRILPLERFTDICQKVYFAVDQYSELDFILANSYLSYVFYEYIVATGKHEYQNYCRQYRQNAQIALSQLPLLLPPSIEAVAALVFGASYAIESSKTTLAWTYISSAANLSQTLGLHCLAGDSETSQLNLFWMVFLLEKSLSLRLGRPSTLRDDEITSPVSSIPSVRRCSQTSSIQGKVYDQLYSPTGLARSDVERSGLAQALALELRGMINENRADWHHPHLPPGSEQDIMRPIYLKIELVMQLSLLTLILRAIPAPLGSPTTITDECATAAHEALATHQECMAAVTAFKNDQFMTNKYLHWGILHTPFVPFSVLFTRIVQLSDGTDLFYLDRFTESLQLGEPSTESITHPYRLYKLLCDAVRLYIQQDVPPLLEEEENPDTVGPWSVFDFAAFGTETSNGVDDSEPRDHLSHGLSDWFYGNQQLMSFLDDDVMF
ncbi:hypothetical protein HD806DRAFT_285119 [Xylariaceae sp. AK1471]|nr:hypothetical protein HD806DRAFT_285119 [Xylariaceae sp. AK1471]